MRFFDGHTDRKFFYRGRRLQRTANGTGASVDCVMSERYLDTMPGTSEL